MGLLDDAIREHLDLKRRRGADPAEVERDEREALGPVRRGPTVDDPAPEAGPGDELEPDDELAYADSATEWDEGWEEADPVAHSPANGDAAEASNRPISRERSPIPEPQAAPAPGQPEPFDHGDQTAEYDVEGDLAKEGQKSEEKQGQHGEDVLEETPDFLQDTPEHDRLWFEQRPPRDFDFDG